MFAPTNNTELSLTVRSPPDHTTLPFPSVIIKRFGPSKSLCVSLSPADTFVDRTANSGIGGLYNLVRSDPRENVVGVTICADGFCMVRER